jgi:hypothetical protein
MKMKIIVRSKKKILPSPFSVLHGFSFQWYGDGVVAFQLQSSFDMFSGQSSSVSKNRK